MAFLLLSAGYKVPHWQKQRYVVYIIRLFISNFNKKNIHTLLMLCSVIYCYIQLFQYPVLNSQQLSSVRFWSCVPIPCWWQLFTWTSFFSRTDFRTSLCATNVNHIPLEWFRAFYLKSHLPLKELKHCPLHTTVGW